ncbi:MAG: hypothetical protein IKB07_08320 [Lachnospiraceae bacterium]|nr:hypothetical protein [Lachnospiraceae bacterium]
MFKVGDEVSVKGEITKVCESGVVVKAHYFGEVYFARSNMDVIGKTYEQGLADAWELAKKVLLGIKDGGFDSNSVMDIFGRVPYFVFKDFTAEEALAKIEAYEKEKEIKVGDVVEDEEGTKALVIDEGLENTCFVFTENGCVEDWYKVDLKKTGKKISIGDLLRQIGE